MGTAVIEAYDWQVKVFEAVNDPATEQIACVGSRGPGKSWTARYVNAVRALTMPNMNHIILRTTSDDVVKQYAQPMEELLNNFPGIGKIPYRYNQTQKVFRITGPGGAESRIYLGYADTEKDARKYMSIEYATATFDECTQFLEIVPRRISGSVRGCENTKMLYFGNPGDRGHGWVKKRFVTKATRDANTLVLQPSLKDNIVMAEQDPGYADRITAGLPEWLKLQWLRGDWDANEGAFFQVPPGCIRGLKVPYYARVIAGVDWGYHPDPFAMVWAAVWRDPWTGYHRCHVFADMKLFRKLDAEQAREAMDYEQSDVFDNIPPVTIRYADPSTGKKTETDSDEQTRTTAKTWARNGLITLPAKRYGRVPGWMLIRQFLTPIPQYVRSDDPMQWHGVLTIDPRCAALITELTEGQHVRDQGGQISNDLAKPDHCFVAGTMIATENGQRAVETILPGDMVLTRKGYAPVVKNWQTEQKPVFTVEFSDGTTIEGSGEHPVFVGGKGFTRIDALRYNDMCVKHTGGHLCQNSKSPQRELNSLSSTESNSAGIQIALTTHIGSISRLEEATGCGASDRCIRRYGRRITGQSRKAVISITRMKTRRTTLSTTWNACRQKNTPQGTSLMSAANGHQNSQANIGISRKNGTDLPRGWSGIVSMGMMYGHAEIQSRTSVNFVGVSTRQERCREASSAPTTANRHGGGGRGLTTWRGRARFAGSHLPPTGTTTPELAPVSVVRVYASGSKPVCNLTVGGEPEYFANGILVHNCADALRYLVTMAYNMTFPCPDLLPYQKKDRSIESRRLLAIAS